MESSLILSVPPHLNLRFQLEFRERLEFAWPIYDRGQIYIWSHNGDYKYFDATKDLIEGSYFDGSGDDPAYRIRLQDIDGNGSVDLFRDIKDSHNGYYALRWEWNGSKFIPKF